MSLAAIAIVVEGLLLALALLFIVALLRSHAEILRRLGALEAAGPTPGARTQAGATPSAPLPVGDIAGLSLAGDAVKLALGPDAPATLLAFLSSGCAACAPLWAGLHEQIELPLHARLVV